jgi:hypothetical protein
MIDALLGEYGIAQIGPTAGARNAALERLVLAMASDGRRVPFAARKQGSRPVKDMFLFLEQLADHVEAEFTAHQEKEPDLLAACRHYKRKSGDKRTPRYLRDLYLEYRSHVKRGPTWLREFIANANLAARDHGS